MVPGPEVSFDSENAENAAGPNEAPKTPGGSGHSMLRRLRFAFGGYGVFAAAIVIFFAKDMYVLKLGANAERAGIIASAWSLLFPLFYPVAGSLMDREPNLISVPGWGRRAPWFLVHLIPLACVVALIYLPGLAWTPLPGSPLLDAWLAIFLFFGGWCITVLYDCFESARAEIYPFNEERALVETMTKFVGALSSGTALLPQMLLWVVFSLQARAICSVLLCLCILLSLEAVPVFKDARQPTVSSSQISWREAWSVLRRKPMFHATLLRMWSAASETTAVNFGIYYLTFTDGLTSVERTKWVMVAGVLVLILEVGLLTPLWGLAWSGQRGGRLGVLARRFVPNMRATCMAFQLILAFLPSMVLQLLPKAVRPWEWVVFTVLHRVLYSPQTFFRLAALCWAIDEDCHLGGGRRREAIHAGVAKLFEDEGRSFTFVLFLILGRLGLQTSNCEMQCDGAGNRSECIEACDIADIRRQPEAVSNFVQATLTYVLPIFSLLCALHIWLFPIHGDRLARLAATQSVNFKFTDGVDSVSNSALEETRVLSPEGHQEVRSRDAVPSDDNLFPAAHTLGQAAWQSP